jgi:V8-like Glu-specific endopeptidase
MHTMIRPLVVATLAAVVASGATLTEGSFSGPGAVAASDASTPVSAPTRYAASADTDPRDYWTPERMVAAKPMAVTRERTDPKVRDSDDIQAQSRRTLATDTQPEPRLIPAAEFQPAATYPFPYGRRSVEKQILKSTPYRQVGRVFFRQNGVPYSCSGSSVVGGGRNVVFTAGHCLNDGAGNWSTNVIFVPARRMGRSKNPYGRFAARELWVPQGWTDNMWWAYDVGAFSVGKNKKRKTLRKSVGALGFAYNQNRVQHWDIFGYPAKKPWSGNKLITCASAYAVNDDNGNGPDSTGVGCDMTGGSSGGPWIIGLRRNNLLNGVVSYGYGSQPGATYSPYFDSTANKIRCAAGTGNANASSC